MNNTLAECPVPCLQHEGELQEFLEFYKTISVKKILEIGTFYGGTMWFFLKNNPKLEHFISLDMPIPPSDERHPQLLESIKLWDSWFEKEKPVVLEKIIGNSHDTNIINNIFSNHKNNDVDLLFIDGDHSYEGVQKDYYNFFPLVKNDGYIVFHDVIGIPEVNKFWEEIKSQHDPNNILEISHLQGGWGIGIIHKD